MHFCRANISIGGDSNNIFPARDFSPISWPEVLVLQYLHGEDAVTDIEPFVQVEQSPRAERHRLIGIYGEEAISQVFARQNPAEMEAPQSRLARDVTWRNPISGEIETAGGRPAPVPDEVPEPEPEPDQEPAPTPRPETRPPPKLPKQGGFDPNVALRRG